MPTLSFAATKGAYHSYLELEADMLALQQKYPAIVKVFVIGNSIEHRNIYAMKISRNVAVEEDKPEVLFLGGHHGREWISVEVPYLLGKYLADNYAADARAVVGKNCHIGAGAVIAGVLEPPSRKPVVIEDEVLVGANAVVLEGVRVGRGSVVAAGAVVVRNVGRGAVVAGVPAKKIKDVKDIRATEKISIVEILRGVK